MNGLGEQFVAYLQREMGLTVVPAETLSPPLPQYLREQLALQVFEIAGRRCVALLLQGEVESLGFKGIQRRVDKTLDLVDEPDTEYCMVAEDLSHYLRRRLMQAGIPFVVVDEQIYLPFLGALMTRRRRRRAPAPAGGESLGPAAQVALIALLLHHVPTPVTATGLAGCLGYTSMTMGRAARALEANSFVQVVEDGRARLLELSDQPARLWDRAQGQLRNPVRDTVRIFRADLPITNPTLAGESALAEATLLAEPREPVFAVASAAWRHLGRGVKAIPVQDHGTCLLELWRYPPEITARDGCVDPLSLALSLRDHPDERVQDALESMIKGLQWSRD